MSAYRSIFQWPKVSFCEWAIVNENKFPEPILNTYVVQIALKKQLHSKTIAIRNKNCSFSSTFQILAPFKFENERGMLQFQFRSCIM